MTIEKNLPFDFCENCEDFILHVEEQVLFADERQFGRTLTVSCKNESRCKKLREHLEDKIHER